MAWNHYAYRTQYRINKKDAECFRTENALQLSKVYHDLSAKRPGIYTMQKRTQRSDEHGFFSGWEAMGKLGWEKLSEDHLARITEDLL